MTPIIQNFLWIKLMKVAAGGGTAVAEEGSSVRWQPDDPDLQVHELLEQRLPVPLFKLERTFRAVEQIHAAPRPAANVEMLSGGRPPGVFGGTVTRAGWWTFDCDYGGDPASDVQIVIHPFIGTRDEAVTWFTKTAEGEAWQIGAVNTALLSFDQYQWTS
jgi:hypothetical protein